MGGGAATTEASNDALLARCRAGDRDALTEVLRRHAPVMEAVIRRVVGPAVEVDDLLQQALLAAVRAFPKFRGDASVRSWLCSIAVCTARDRLRSPELRRRVDLDPEAQRDAAGDRDGAGRLDRQLAGRRQLRRIYVHLEHIDPQKRTAFVLHVFDGKSIEQVAALTHASISATKSRVFWARKELLARVARDPSLRELLEGPLS